ncbi:hypothetical protein Vretimale_5936 [Volvox reticuliferus]|uniref:Uncharacterized protein n=1 Tax=Volvox reticuliferus TaxID=1737510 RepID=A0A8J4LL23_9CHLO|nr:hypothetical protein Vretifemale_5944 [Volvox reticuliferus]GIM01083.1 hypothetical protein Vretimale_5936 [Volvox reticuliferus]
MVNHNVRITFAVRITDGIATGIWASSVLSTYINVLEGDDDRANERVGYAQAIQGTFLAAAAIPAGWLAIKHRRDSILKVMGLVAFAAIAITSAALVLDVPYKYGLLCCGLALWGVAQANAPVLDALFADSVPTGNRSKLYTWLHMSYIVAQGIGPGVGAAMFAINGNVWKLEVLQHVMLLGMALAMIPALLMLCLDDDKALGAESEGLLGVAQLRPTDGAEGREEEVEGCGGSRRHVAYKSQGGSRSQSRAGGDADYRRPFLEGWSSDAEHDYRNQVSGACSPARPVFPTIAAAAHGYTPPDVGSISSSGAYSSRDVGFDIAAVSKVPSSSVGITVATSPRVSDAGVAIAVMPGVQPAPAPTSVPQAISHALLLSPTTSSPTTDHFGMTASVFNSPTPPSADAAIGGSSSGGGGGGGGGFRNTAIGGAAVAEAAVWPGELLPSGDRREMLLAGASAGVDGWGQGKDVPMGGAEASMTSAAVVERFHAVRDAVDEAAVAAAEVPSSSAVNVPTYESFRNLTIRVRPMARVDLTLGSDGGSGITAVDGDDSGAGSSREPSLMADSVRSELSFNSLLTPGSFKSVRSRTFSRAGSSSSCGSARGGGSSSGAGGGALAAVAAAASPPLALLPFLEEESAAEAEVISEPDTPKLSSQTLQAEVNQPPPLLYPVTAPVAVPSAAAAAAVITGDPILYKDANTSGLMGASLGSSGIDTTLSPPWGSTKNIHTSPSERLPAITAGPPAAVPAVATVASVAAVVYANDQMAVGDGSGGDGGIGAHEGSRWRPIGPAPAAAATNPREPPPQLTVGSTSLDPMKYRFLCLNMAWIPGVLALTDCTMGLASGMTIKFFPIFFKDAVRLAPMYVNLMYCAIPLCLSAAAYLAQRESRLLGRVQTMVLNRGIGITLLYWIATHTNRWHDQRLMVPIYIARTSIMNSIYPLQKSILMDFVPKERRAAWNSLESVTSFGWSGSAALGGWLIHKFGFQTTFLITATMQCIGWGLSMMLLPIVPRKEAGLQATCRTAASTSVATGCNGGRAGRHSSPVARSSSASPGRR